jgi:hypothetical protein
MKQVIGGGWTPYAKPMGPTMPRRLWETCINNHLPVPLRSRADRFCLFQASCAPNDPCDACQLCHGWRDRDDDELAIDA